MLIGNRQIRPQAQRTTSTTRLTVGGGDSGQGTEAVTTVGSGGGLLSPGNHRRNFVDFANCGFCKHRLAPGRDIYMYKGDAAFCSVECREQQIKYDEDETQNGVGSSSSN